jgi:hypothetical protein
MSILLAAITGLVVQGIGLGAFIVIANTPWASPGKQVVVVLTFVSMLVLLFFASKPYVFKRSVALSALLALGYLIAYHVLGAIFFPSLLKDMAIPSIEHLRAIAPIFGLLFVLYLVGTASMGLLQYVRAKFI